MRNLSFSRLIHASQKVYRASKHIEAAESFVVDYNRTAIHVDVSHDPSSGNNTLAFAPAKFNIDLCSIVGDAVHNLSCALDCAVSQIVAEKSGRDIRRIYFPVAENMPDLRESFAVKTDLPCKCGTNLITRAGRNADIRKLVPELEAMIVDEFKPCASEKSYLWQVRKSDNIDKHSKLLLLIAKVSSSDLNFTTKEGGGHLFNHYELEPGHRYDLGVSKHPFTIIGQPTFQTTFIFGQNSPMAGQGLFDWLWSAYEVVLTSVMQMERRFGHLVELPTA